MVESYSERLKRAMADAKMSIPALARAMKISYQGVRKAVEGGKFGTENNINAARQLGVESEWLATGKGRMRAKDEPESEPQRVPEEYAQLLTDLDDIPPKRRSALLDHIHQLAQEAREAAEHLHSRERAGTAALRGGTKKSVATLTYGDGNKRQRRLPLTTVDDPFTAEPDDRETALYRRIEQSPKAADNKK